MNNAPRSVAGASRLLSRLTLLRVHLPIGIRLPYGKLSDMNSECEKAWLTVSNTLRNAPSENIAVR